MDKKKVMYESIERSIDTETGEVKEIKTNQTIKVEKEPEFIKIYINSICAFKGLEQSLSPILLEFCHYVSFANNEDGQIIIVNKFIKGKIAEKLNISVARVNQGLTKIIKADVFRKIENQRGVYIVNPYIIGKGEWKDIKELRANFNFTNGNIELDIKGIEE